MICICMSADNHESLPLMLSREQYIEAKLKSKGRSAGVSDADQNNVDANNGLTMS